jgi:hypothetical protein
MNEKIEAIEELKRVVLSITLEDIKDKGLIDKLLELKGSIDDIIKCLNVHYLHLNVKKEFVLK